MKSLRFLAIAGLAAACGSSGLSTADFRANAPTYDKLAVAQNDSDTNAPSAAADPNPSGAVTAPDCHPHLFERTGEVIGRVNRHFFKLVHHVGDLIQDNPTLATAGSKTWENVRDGLDRKLTMTATTNTDGSVTYDFELDVKAAGSTGDFVKVMTGSLTHTGAATADVTDTTAARVENKGSVTFDFDALASVKTDEQARGQITDTFDNVRDPAQGVKRSATIALTNFVPDDHGDLHGPRTGSYSWEREPGVGGKFQFEDSLVLLCPSNPSNAVADLTAVARWYKNSDGSVRGRSDAKATGGQFAGNTWLGVTCAKGQTTAAPAEGYWMMKLENPSGATVAGQADTLGSTPCDSAFGPVPSVSDNSTDYDFSAAVTFPGEW